MGEDETSRLRLVGPRPFGAGVAAALVSLFYSGLLGFGVNERCTSIYGCSSAGCGPCARLGTYSWVHVVMQVLLAVGASIALGRAIRRAEAGGALQIRIVILVGWGVLAFAGLYAYTKLSWAWADRAG